MEGRKQILIGDNDEDLLMRLQVLLENQGYATTIAWGGHELVKELQSERFDLILLGDYLPDITSGELWQNLRRHATSASIALLETREPVKEMASRYLGAGGQCVLERSSPYKIVETVCACLNRRKNQPFDRATAAGRTQENANAAAGTT